MFEMAFIKYLLVCEEKYKNLVKIHGHISHLSISINFYDIGITKQDKINFLCAATLYIIYVCVYVQM